MPLEPAAYPLRLLPLSFARLLVLQSLGAVERSDPAGSHRVSPGAVPGRVLVRVDHELRTASRRPGIAATTLFWVDLVTGRAVAAGATMLVN